MEFVEIVALVIVSFGSILIVWGGIIAVSKETREKWEDAVEKNILSRFR